MWVIIFIAFFQTFLVMYLNGLREVYRVKFRAVVEQRMRVHGGDDSVRRYRIPDVCVLEAGSELLTSTGD